MTLKLKCNYYSPWTKSSELINSDECFHYIYFSGRCDHQNNTEHRNEPCPWQGNPNVKEDKLLP